MRSVSVLGGGPAGFQAALAAADSGARVTLFELTGRLPLGRDSWPSLLHGGAPEDDNVKLLRSKGVELRLGCRVNEVLPDLTTVSVSGRQRFDAVVVATGSAPVPLLLPGAAKTGVHILDGEESYLGLRDASLGYSRVIVGGVSPASLEVAERLHRTGIRVVLDAPRGLLPARFSQLVHELVRDALEEADVPLTNASIDRVVGAGRVEAAILGGAVYPCDGLVLVPPVLPLVPRTAAWIGRHGGMEVNAMMESSARGIYAAGACAEYPLGNTTRLLMLESSAGSSGWVAGINASGGSLPRVPVGLFSRRFMGVEVRSAGLGLFEARAAGYRASESALVDKGAAVCSMVFEARSRRILGVQLATRGRAPAPEFFAIAASEGVLLENIACLEHCNSTDISLVIETAREGIRTWQRS